MADAIIHCPACNHKLRVPPDLFGEPVQCPQCGETFSAPVPSGAEPGEAAPPVVRPLTAPAPATPRSLRGPAIGLLVLSFVSVVVNMTGLFRAVVRPDEVRQQADEAKQVLGQFFKQPIPDTGDPVLLQRISSSVFLAMALTIMLAAIVMLQRRYYWLALVGSFLALLNCGELCCVPSAIFAIWALVVLFNPATRLTFH
jgi:hypothetical protein